MAKTLTEAPLTTASARAKLGTGEYARRLDADAALWYRKGKRGGVWFARWRNHGQGAAYKQKPVGAANDQNDKISEGTLTFLQAEAEARKIVAQARGDAKAQADGPPITVRSAVEQYIEARNARETARSGRQVRSNASHRLGRYLFGAPAWGPYLATEPNPIADLPLHKLTKTDLLNWRASLPTTMKYTTAQRLVADFKAALNSAYAKDDDRLPASLPVTIKAGFASSGDQEEAEEDRPDIGRENQILSDAQIASLIRAAREVDTEKGLDGDLFRLVVVMAATGARFSQIIRLQVRDCQITAGRLLIPRSRKGKRSKKRSKPPIEFPIGRDVVDALVPSVTGRAPDEPLLVCPRYRHIPGTIKWEVVGRGAWQSPKELAGNWGAIRERAKLPGIIPYALRHSSIVRAIRETVPLQLVAAAHDTSVVMIEQHYAAFITSGLEEVLRKVVVPLVPKEGGADVVPLRSAHSA